MAISSFNQRELIDRQVNHANPMFDFLSGMMPDTLKELFRWCDYLYINNSNIYAGLTKLAAYVITDITYDTDNATLRTQQKLLMERHLRIKPVLKAVLRDVKLYGNAFVSVLSRFRRFYKCPGCGITTALRKCRFKFNADKLTLAVTCPECRATATHHLRDEVFTEARIRSHGGVHIKRWDPQQMDIHTNRVTGETEYWYTFPSSVASRVRRGDALHIADMPLEVLEAICKNRAFRFDDNEIYHMRLDAPSGLDGDVWGLPVIVAALKRHYYAAVLRKANEAIALDFLVPLRVIYPESAGGENPFAVMGMDVFREAITTALKQHRRDNLHTLVSPIGVGVAQLGGQGRALLTLGELQQAEDEIIACLGLPREFIYGGLSFTGTSVSLRMLENQLLSDKTDAVGLLNWIGAQCSQILGWELVDMDVVPFKFVDDVQQKGMEMGIHGQLGGRYLSTRAIAEANGRDIDQLRKERKEDAIAEAQLDREIQLALNALQSDLATASELQAQSQRGAGLAYDQAAVLAAADPLVEELLQLDYGERRSRLAALQGEDVVMYAVVVHRLEQARRAQAQQGAQQGEPTT